MERQQRILAQWITKEAVERAIVNGEYDPDLVVSSEAICASIADAESLSSRLDIDSTSRVSIQEGNGDIWTEVERYVDGDRVY